MSRRGITIVVLLILGVLALATWGGTQLGGSATKQQVEDTQVELISANDELSRVQSEYAALQQDNAELSSRLSMTEAALLQTQAQYATSEQKVGTLNTELTTTGTALSNTQAAYASSQRSTVQLQAQLTSTTEELANIQSAYRSMNQENDDLQAKLASTRADYDRLAERYEALEATKEFVVDNRLTVRLFTETQSGGATWIRGEVTNTSDKTIGRIYVLVTRYDTGGKLNSLDLPPAVILNLAPSDVGYFTFMSVGGPIKVTVLGDY